MMGILAGLLSAEFSSPGLLADSSLTAGFSAPGLFKGLDVSLDICRFPCAVLQPVQFPENPGHEQ